MAESSSVKRKKPADAPAKKPRKKTQTFSPPTHNSVVTKHNSLLPKLSKMQLAELRLLSFCLAHYDSRPEFRNIESLGDVPIPQESLEHRAKVKDLIGIFPSMDSKSAYGVVRQVVLSLNSKPFQERQQLSDGSTEDVFINWFSSFSYNHDRGQFTFRLSPEIVHLVLSQHRNFTRFRLQHVYQFRSAITWKLYELLKQWVAAGRWAVALDELKVLLGVAEKYSRWESLKTVVLERAKIQINELSDIRVDYERQRSGHTTTGVIFFITTKEQEEHRKDPTIAATIGDTNNDIRLLMKVGLNETNAQHLSRLAADAGKDLKYFLDTVVARYEAKPEDSRGVKQAYVYKALLKEFMPSLFDDSGESVAKAAPRSQDKKAAAQSRENNLYASKVNKCENYKLRAAGAECPNLNQFPHCKICKRMCDLIKPVAMNNIESQEKEGSHVQG